MTCQPSGPVRPLKGSRETARRLARAHRHRDQHWRRRQAAQERAEQLDRPGVRPVQVVQDQHKRLARGKRLQQVTHRSVRAVALVLDGDAATRAEPRKRWEHVRELGARRLVELIQPSWVEPLGVLVERIDEDPERQVALELGRGAGEHELAARFGAIGELGQQPGLADAGLADDRDCGGGAVVQCLEEPLEGVELGGAAHEQLEGARHQLRSACSTARASSTREDTASLRNMFRMCDSTVFWLRKRLAAI